jgi:hypothetical protein
VELLSSQWQTYSQHHKRVRSSTMFLRTYWWLNPWGIRISQKVVAFRVQTDYKPWCAHQGSQARRRVEMHGPKARNLRHSEQVFDRLIDISGPKRGAFRPFLPPKCTCPPREAP